MEESNVTTPAEASTQQTASVQQEEARKAALYDAFAPSLETLAKRYGLTDPADPAALAQALEQERQQVQQRKQAQAQRLYDAWMDQAEKTRQRYPGFDLAKQMQDPRFQALLKARLDVCTAYEALHRSELLTSIETRLRGKLAPRRPRENGTASQGAVITKSDISRMSRADRQAIIQRVQRGEKITF